MLQTLKHKTLPGKLLQAVVLLVAAVAIFIFLAHGPETLSMLVNGPKDLFSLDVDELEGQYVTADINVLFDTYAETTRDGKTTHREYIMPVANQVYMGVNVPKSMLDDADAVMESTLAVMNYEADELDGSVLKITGTVQRMNAQTEEFYRSTIEQDYEGDNYDGFLPLVLEEGEIRQNSIFNFGLFCVVSAVLAVMGIITLVRALSGWYQRDIKAWCNAQPDPEAASAQLDDFYNGTTPFNKVLAGRDFLMLDNGGDSWLLETKNIAWAYQTTTQHRTNGIPTGKSYTVTVRTKDAKNNSYSIPVRKEAGAKEMLAYLQDNLHDLVTGYTPEWEAMYNASPAEFASRVFAARAAQSARTAVDAPDGLDNPYGIDEPPAEQPATCCVLLRAAGERKIEVLSAIREATGLGLAEAKALTDAAYSKIDLKDAAAAQALVVKLQSLGADAVLM